MSPVDTAWLRMDRENHLMAIKGVLVIEGSLERAVLLRLLDRRLIQHFARFSQRVLQLEGVAWWEGDPEFELARHVQWHRLPPGPAQVRLQEMMGRLSEEPLDAQHPLWQIEVVEGYGADTALILRVHHCVADGLALMGVLQALTGPTPHASLLDHAVDGPTAGVKRPRTPASASAWDAWLDFITQGPTTQGPTTQGPGTQGGSPSGEIAAGLLARYAQLVDDPEQLGRLRQLAPDALAAALQLLWLPNDSASPFKVGGPGPKALAWAPALKLTEVQAVAAYLHCTVNEVALACVAGAVRRHLVAHQQAVDGMQLRVLVPVNLRRRRRLTQLGNRFGLVPLLLPVGLANPVRRVRAVMRQLRSLRHSFLPPLSLGLMGTIGLAPPSAQQQAIDLLSHKATGVVTHVPGPRSTVYLAGRPVRDMMFWVPQSGRLGLGVSLISYAGTLRMGLITQAGPLREPQRVARFFAEEFENLALGLMMGLERSPD